LPLLLYIANLPIIGMAKPVPVNPLNYRNYRWGEFAVSLAGPLSNLVLAALFSLVLRLGIQNPGLMAMAQIGVSINILLALFNLIPIPPLDGSHILAIFLPRELARLYAYLQPVGFILILVLFYTGVMTAILMPLYRWIAIFLLG
jgi:Zn-dependent protease